MGEIHLDWGEATVEDDKLTVPLDGEIPEGWQHHFETTVKLLGHGQWGSVEIDEQAVRVDGIGSGDEDDLRFYLEGVVEQANSAESADQERERSDDDGGDSGSGSGSGSGSDSAPEGPDAELTERFRSFADQREPGSDQGDPDSEQREPQSGRDK